MMYERRHTRAISAFGGLKRYVPMLATMLLIATLSSIAVPFFNGFVGEFPIMLGTWMSQPAYLLGGFWPTALCATGMIWSAVYMLWWYQRLMLGPITHDANRHLPDLKPIEWGVLVPLACLVFWFGLGSNYWTQRMDDAVETLLPVQSSGRELSELLNDNLPMTAAIRRERLAATLSERYRAPRRPSTPSVPIVPDVPPPLLQTAPPPVKVMPQDRDIAPKVPPQPDTAPAGTGNSSPAPMDAGSAATPHQ